MVIGLVAVTAGQPFAAEMVLVTVYVPGVLVAKFICPVLVLTKFNPDVEENVPATPPPINVGEGLAAF